MASTNKGLKRFLAARKAQIKKDNRAFAKLSKAQKRVTIARDVLAQMAAGRIRAAPGTYVSGANETSLASASVVKKMKNRELRDLLATVPQCDACALGSLFVCGVERADALTVGDSKIDRGRFGDGTEKLIEASSRTAYRYLSRFFDKKQLAMIETAFEKGSESDQSGSLQWNDYESFSASRDFADSISDATDRLRLIMENIVANKGRFMPEKKPVSVPRWTTPGYTEAS